MKYLFWFSSALIFYTYAGYLGWLWLRGFFRYRPVQRRPFFPSVTAVIVVRNEEQTLAEKIAGLSSLDYPADKINFVIVSDGSTDSTNTILRGIADPRFRILICTEREGKASGLNRAIQGAQGDILLFTDARQKLESSAVRLLMENFADSTVGAASGALMLGDPDAGEVARGMGIYWRLEKKVRELESKSGSVVGATGALYAARRSLMPTLSSETVLDDVYLPLCVARQGGRVIFDARARAWDVPSLGEQREFARKVRTLSGNYQLLQMAPWLLSRQNPVRFEFVSHKLLRLVVPFALAMVLLCSFLIPEPLYRFAGLTQLVFYGIGVLGLSKLPLGPLARLADAALTFVVLNTAAVVAFKNFVTRRRVAW